MYDIADGEPAATLSGSAAQRRCATPTPGELSSRPAATATATGQAFSQGWLAQMKMSQCGLGTGIFGQAVSLAVRALPNAEIVGPHRRAPGGSTGEARAVDGQLGVQRSDRQPHTPTTA